MDNEFAKNEKDYIRDYEAQGYTTQYRIVGDELEDLETKTKYKSEDVTIHKEHRYEGMSNPSDMSLLYVIETMDGSKGTMLASYGADGNSSIHEFMNAVPKKNVNTDSMTPPDADA